MGRRKSGWLQANGGARKHGDVWIGVSQVTGKFLVKAFVNGEVHTISPHFKREDAEFGANIVRQRLQEFSPQVLATQSGYSEFLCSLNYSDDDEPLGVGRFVDGQLVVDTTSQTLGDARSIWSEHDLASDAVSQSWKNQQSSGKSAERENG